jgi:AcrR family transcriptional regulator
MADTRRRILATARELFNAEGVHRVGVRDIARALDISAGNLQYHFATKDDLVTALLQELHELNARTAFTGLDERFSLAALYRAAIAAMKNILVYRFVMLGYVDAVRASPELQKREAQLAVARRRRTELMMKLLVQGGYLETKKVARARFLQEQGELIASGWLAAAELKPGKRDDEKTVLHYAKVGVALLEPYCTPKGAREMAEILSGELDGRRRSIRS